MRTTILSLAIAAAVAVILPAPWAAAASGAASDRPAHQPPGAGTVLGGRHFGWYGLGGHGAPRERFTLHDAAAGAAGSKTSGSARVEAGSAGAQVASACGTSFSVAPSPNVGTSDNQLNAAFSASATDVWAVGHYSVDVYGEQVPVPLIEHNTGAGFAVVPSPSIPSTVPSGELMSVSGTSSADVWAVGDYVSSAAIGQALIEHYNGTQWTFVPSPGLPFGQLGNFLTSVVAISPTNVWAVGYYEAGNTAYRTLVEHYNGVSWAVVASPNVGTAHNFLLGVTAVSPGSVLAVGGFYTGYATVPVTARTLTERFNGSSWSVVPSPNLDTQLGADNNFLFGVAAVPGTGTAWAVGQALLDVSPGAQSNQALVERWNGSGWSIVASPSFLPYQGGLFAVAPVSPADVYAVGAYLPGSGFDQTLVERWNGSSWSRVPSPNVASLYNDLLGVTTAPAAGQVVAVGTEMTGTSSAPGATRTLVEQACGV